MRIGANATFLYNHSEKDLPTNAAIIAVITIADIYRLVPLDRRDLIFLINIASAVLARRMNSNKTIDVSDMATRRVGEARTVPSACGVTILEAIDANDGVVVVVEASVERSPLKSLLVSCL